MGLFQSFLMGGYECADHVNRLGDRVNLLQVTGHSSMVDVDYALLGTTGIKTVREGICWSQVETKPYVYDFTEVGNRIRVAEEFGIQQLWDICHFGFPDDLIPTHPKFTNRFVALCKAFAEYYLITTRQTLIVTPINEISFLSWHAGDVRGTVPFAINSGFDIKYHLCKAAIQGIKALRIIDPQCRILLSEPLIRVHSLPGDSPDRAKQCNEDQFQAMDMIGGKMCPELGGSEDLLDILGLNYYHNCQWDTDNRTIGWPLELETRIPLRILLEEAYRRYNRPVVITETGHFGSGRGDWIREIFEEVMTCLKQGIPIEGVCIYPLIDRPDWDDVTNYHNSGLWDIDPVTKERTICRPYMESLSNCIKDHKRITQESISAFERVVS